MVRAFSSGAYSLFGLSGILRFHLKGVYWIYPIALAEAALLREASKEVMGVGLVPGPEK